jgi:FlgD Ig-like domain
MRSSRYASLTRLLIGASLVTGLVATSATSALAASAVTFGVLREEDPHNGVQTTDQVYRDTDTISATGAAATGITISLSSASPAQTATVDITAPTGGDLVPGTYGTVTDTPTATKPGLVVTIDGTVCVSSPAHLEVNQLAIVGSDVTQLNVFFEITCPAAGFGEVHGQLAINSTSSLKALATSPANTLAIGNVDIGATSAPAVITYTNIGNVSFDMSGLTKGGRYPEFYTMTENCPAALNANATCTATFVFKPTTYGLKETAVTVPDIAMDGLNKEVLVTATGLLTPNGPNDTPAHAIDVSSLPAYSGVQINTIDPSASPCGPDERAGWWHFKSATVKTVALSTTQSDVGTSIALYSGSSASPTFIKCGVNADAELHDSMTFSAAANVDYWIRIARETPGDYAIVLKAVLGSPDTMVDVTSFKVNYSTFYPVVDTYKDLLTISAVRNEQASASIAIYSPTGTKVRTLTVPMGAGAYSVTWNGKNTAGTLQAAGKYKVVQTVTDVSGNKLSDTRYSTLSRKKLVTKTYVKLTDFAKANAVATTGTGSASKTTTVYKGGLKMTSGSSGTISAAFAFVAPAATTYKTIKFESIGDGAAQTMTIGLQDWTLCASVSPSCITTTASALVGKGTASVSETVAKAIKTGTHAIRAYVFAPTMPGTTRTIDGKDVRITVTYTVLQ